MRKKMEEQLSGYRLFYFYGSGGGGFWWSGD
jgi:hypothetical protein